MCKCIEKTNKVLKEQGLELVVMFRHLKDLGTIEVLLPIATVRINPKNRKVKIVTLTGEYCPICGEKMISQGGQ